MAILINVIPPNIMAAEMMANARTIRLAALSRSMLISDPSMTMPIPPADTVATTNNALCVNPNGSDEDGDLRQYLAQLETRPGNYLA